MTKFDKNTWRYDPAGPSGPRAGFAVGKLKVDEMLRQEDRAEYAALLSDPEVTPSRAREWLLAHGYRVGRGAVVRHRRHFLNLVRKVRRTARVSDALGQLAASHGGSSLSDVTLTRFQMILMERLFGDNEEESRDIARNMTNEEMLQIAKILDSAVGTRKQVEQMRQQFEDARRKAAEEVDRAAKKGADGVTIANRVREILGVPLPKA